MATHHDGDLVEAYDCRTHGGTLSRWAHWAVFVVLTCLCLNAGCVSTPSPAAEQVRLVHETSLVNECRLLGEVRSGSPAPLMGWTAHTLTNARTELKDEAVKKGGNMVLVTQTNANPWGTWMYGEAYACPGRECERAAAGVRSPRGKEVLWIQASPIPLANCHPRMSG